MDNIANENKGNFIDNQIKKLNEKMTHKLIYGLILAFLSFIIPLCITLIIFSSLGFAPFKENGLTIISFDMQSEYVAYLRYFKYVLVGDNSLIYSQGKVFGGDFLSIYTFYLASPFNYFIVFCPDEGIPIFFLFTSILKISFSSLNFYFLLRFSNKQRKLGYLMFSIAYGLISYSFLYISNFMWLDGVMVLPLVILGLNLLKEKRQLWLYPVAIFYCLMTSWYTGFIICLFTLIYIIYSYFTMDGKLKKNLDFLLRAVIFSLVGGFLASCYWLTAYLHFSGTKASQEFPSFKFFSISMLFTGFMENNYSSPSLIQQYSGYISMYIGVVVLVFFFRYFTNKGYSIKERIGTLILCLLYVLVIENSWLNALFHGGKEPTWFPGRYSFAIGFLVSYLGSKEFDKYNESSKWSFITPIVAVTIALPIVIFTKNSSSNELYQYYTFSPISLIVYLVTTLLTSIYPFIKEYKFIKNNKLTYQALLSLCLVPIACYSSYRGAKNIVQTNVNSNVFQKYETYFDDDSYTPIYDAIKEYDNNKNYRMESTFNRNGNYNSINNNPMFYSYNGLSHFSSSAKKYVEEFMDKLGFQYNGFFEKYDGGSTSSINSFLNIKYLIDSSSYGSNKPYFQTNTNSLNNWKKLDLNVDNESITYYENTKALPYAFVMEDVDREWVGDGYNVFDSNGNTIYTHWYDKFEFQNELFKCLTNQVTVEKTTDDGTTSIQRKDIFVQIPTTIVLSNNESSYVEQEDGYKITNIKKGDSITYSFSVPSEAYGNNLYFSEKSLSDGFSYYVDGSRVTNNTYWHKGIRGIKDNSSHYHKIKLTAQNDYDEYVLRLSVVYEDFYVMNEYLDVLRNQSSMDLKQKNSLFSYSYEGTINISENNKDKSLLFTFPSEKNVTIKIDGKAYEVLTRINIFSCVDFSNLSIGSHTIEFKYTDKGLIGGYIISFLSLISLVFLCIYYKKLEDLIFRRDKKNKEQKKCIY